MALVLDTAEFPAADRAEALREGMRVAGVPANVTPVPAHDVSAACSCGNSTMPGRR